MNNRSNSDGIEGVRPVPAGPAAFYLYLDEEPSPELSRRVRGLAENLRKTQPAGVHDIVPGYASVLVEHAPHTDQARLLAWAAGVSAEANPPAPGKGVTLGVRYGEAADRAELEARLGLPWHEIVRLHASADYTVAFTGFTPGYPYLLGLPEPLHLPRRETPRPDVPAGAVAVAGAQAGIYPAAGPGGWWVLGRTDAPLWEPGRDPPALFETGDRVRFVAEPALQQASAEATGPAGLAGPAQDIVDRSPCGASPLLEVLQAWPRSVSLQGRPRRHGGRYGMAQCGALDPLAFELCNDILGNPTAAPALELLAQSAAFGAREDLAACVTGGGFEVFLDSRPLPTWQRFAWPRGSVLELVPSSRATGLTSYLAVSGGLAAETYRGSASTDVRAGVGGHCGRFLREGDLLAGAHAPTGPGRPYPGRVRYPERAVLRIHPGPQYDAGAFGRLLGSSFRLDATDRMGARLAGPKISLESHDVLSEGSPHGAVQLPADGQPIILLADRGRTGGYPKPAICDVRDLWRLAQARPGTEVWLVAG